MKILHITPWYEPAWASGGTAVAAANLCRSLARAGVDVTVFTTTDAGSGGRLYDEEHFADLGGVKIHYYPCGLGKMKVRQGALSLGLVKAILKCVKNFDLVHIHATRHIYGVVASSVCRRHNIPYIVTPHASLMKYWVEKIGNPIIKKIFILGIDRWVTKYAASMHYLSLLEAESSEKWAFNSRYVIAPNGVNQTPSPGVPTPLNREAPIKLIHVGRIHPQKNTLALVKAVLSFSSSELVLDIIGAVGDVDYHRQCLEAIAVSGNNNVSFLGSMNFDQVQDAYKRYDLFCMPSLVEGVSMALIEAASNGLPALITEYVGNCREIVSDGAGILTGLSPEEIVQSLSNLLANKDQLILLKRAARKSVEKRYNLEAVANVIMNKYKELL